METKGLEASEGRFVIGLQTALLLAVIKNKPLDEAVGINVPAAGITGTL